jgi:hypothetical protein
MRLGQSRANMTFMCSKGLLAFNRIGHSGHEQKRLRLLSCAYPQYKNFIVSYNKIKLLVNQGVLNRLSRNPFNSRQLERFSYKLVKNS